MPMLFLLLGLWPLVCCEQCNYTPVCLTVSIVAAVMLYIVASIIRELRALSIHRPSR